MYAELCFKSLALRLSKIIRCEQLGICTFPPQESGANSLRRASFSITRNFHGSIPIELGESWPAFKITSKSDFEIFLLESNSLQAWRKLRISKIS